MGASIKRVLVALAVVAPAWLSLDFIGRYGVDVPFMDDWELVTTIQQWKEGRLELEGLLAFHNEHRIFFPRVVMLAVALSTEHNLKLGMAVGWLFLLATGGLLWREYSRGEGASPQSLARWIPAAWLLFSVRQHQNLLWAWQVQFFMCVFFSVAALLALRAASQRPGFFGLALGCGVAASLCIAGGFAVWPAGAAQWCLEHLDQPGERRRKLAVGVTVWLLVGALCLALYMRGYVPNPSHPSAAYIASAPHHALRFFLLLFGSPFTDYAPAAFALGTAVVLAFVGLVWRAGLPWKDLAFPAGLLAFAAVFAGMIAAGRGGWGDQAVLASRYATPMALGVYGVFRAGLAVRRRKIRYSLGAGAAILTVLLVVMSTEENYPAGEVTRRYRQHLAQVLLAHRELPPAELFQLYPPLPSRVPNPEQHMAQWVQTLERLRLSVFAQSDDPAR